MEPTRSRSGARRAQLAPAWARRHPVAVVAAVAAVVAVAHGAWIITHRRLGAYDPDEAGYLASALRYHRTLSVLHPMEFVRAVGGTANGPVVPLLSLPLLLVGPDDPHTAMLVQPLLLALVAVMVAWTTRRLAGPAATIVAGVSCLAMPTFVFAAQSYWYGLGAAAVMTVTIGALLRSDRLSNRWTWVFGIGLGLLPMTRTMAVAFVPGVLAGAAALVWPDRARLRRLALAAVVSLCVVGPWFAVNRRAILDYLVGYGYGSRAGLYGSGNFVERVGFRIERIAEGAGVGLVIAVILGVATVSAVAVGVRRGIVSSDRDRWREPVALAVPLVIGFVALASTSNNGVWFELPIMVLAVPLAAAVLARAWRPLRWVVSLGVVAMLVVVSSVTWWLVDPIGGQLGFGIDGAQYEGGFRLYDERFSTDRRSEAPAAAADWAALSADVSRRLHRIDDSLGGAVFTISGNMQMFNNNSVLLQSELDGWDALFVIPDTTLDARSRREYLTTHAQMGRHGRRERVLVLALHRQHLFPPDFGIRRFADQALDSGWRVVERIPMPDGGEVQILRSGQRAG